ncbi:sulfite exporter TauE/SafE family protein [Paludibacterium yongneupense]|uniref:sulfite exporter TauE/SafE family protein n=1 Tax=Paludibacterium yongneupense TaxID=400061 RepID=UPI000424AA9F|nr:TSUP family transporter [Paludibacterium yongneupense]
MLTLTFLCVFAYLAGLIDAAVGGGGLIQIPAMFALLPGQAPASLLGTNKMVSATGTLFATRSYLKRVQIPWGLILPATCAAFAMSFVGAAAVAHVPKSLIRPMVLGLLLLVGAYTLRKKDFGAIHKPARIGLAHKALAMAIGAGIGFYDGLFGPGTGSFLIFLFIRCFGFDFIHASASAKVVNLATNIAALAFFIPTGHVMYSLAIPMALCNIAGAVSGSRLAIRRGTVFVRKLFLVLTSCLIVKLAYDLLV